jgi:GMP synthase-like glutamine amidotransferase
MEIYTHIAGSKKVKCGDYSGCIFERGPHTIVQIGSDPVFAGLPREFRSMESHCGQIGWPPKGWVQIATCGPKGKTKVKCLRLRGRPIYAAQFHIEMPGTPESARLIMGNFLRLAAKWNEEHPHKAH